MRLRSVVLVTCVLAPAALFGHPSSFSVSPSVSFLRLDPSFRIDPGLMYGAGVGFSVARSLDAWLSGQAARLHSSYDSPSGSMDMPIEILLVSGGIRFSLTDPKAPVSLSLGAGAGMLRFLSDAQGVRVGALGVLNLPARHDARAVLTASLSLSAALSTAVTAYLEPGLVAVSPLSDPQRNYSISGGIRVALF